MRFVEIRIKPMIGLSYNNLCIQSSLQNSNL